MAKICGKCGHNMIDHPFGRCHIPGCYCSLPCRKCGHAMNQHFFSFCLEQGCTCPLKEVNKNVRSVDDGECDNYGDMFGNGIRDRKLRRDDIRCEELGEAEDAR